MSGNCKQRTAKEPKVTIHPRIAGPSHISTSISNERLSLNEMAPRPDQRWRFCVVFREHAGVSRAATSGGSGLRKVQSLRRRRVAGIRSADDGFYDQSHLCSISRTRAHDAGQFITASALPSRRELQP